MMMTCCDFTIWTKINSRQFRQSTERQESLDYEKTGSVNSFKLLKRNISGHGHVKMT